VAGGARRAAPPLCVAAVLAITVLVAVAGSVPPRVIPASGDFLLERGARVMTAWVEVPAGGQAVWAWEGGGYINFEVEARAASGGGFVAGDDTGSASGCVRGDGPFAVGLGWQHTALFGSDDAPVMLHYSVAAQSDQRAPCAHLSSVGAGGTGGGWFSRSLEWNPFAAFVLPLVAGNISFYVVRKWAARPPPEERRRLMVEHERAVQAREAWVAERVRRGL
jgi:hypothetical protein